MGSALGQGNFHRRSFFGTFFTYVSLSFFAAVLEAFWWCRDLLFSVFTAEIQCFLRFHEVRRLMISFVNFSIFLDHFGSILAVKNSLVFMFFSSRAAGCILGPFWDHFGHPLAPFGLPLGSVCRHFCTLVAPLSLSAPSGGVLWASFRSLRAFW